MENKLGNVCIVDEHDEVRDGLCALPEAFGLSAHAHASPKDLLEEHNTHPREDVVVLDLEMSEKNGAEVIKILRDRGSEVSVILLTYDSDCFAARWSAKHGAVVLQKPLRSDAFIQTINSLLRAA